jgi:hypothetical protein
VRAALRSAGAAATVTWLVQRLLERRPPRITGWSRPNYRGHPVSLSGGAASAAGAAAGVVVGPTRSGKPMSLLLLGAAATAGCYDDLVAVHREQQADKGWHGHLAALRAGRVSGGMVKAGLIGAASLVAAADGNRSGPRRGPLGACIDAGLIAGTANLLNLFDLRPGRAGKVAGLTGAATVTGPAGALAASVLGAVAATLPADLGERVMLGDLGANALGVLLGRRLSRAGPALRWTAVGTVTALTLASEKVSFSAVVDRTPTLRALDRLGRR